MAMLKQVQMADSKVEMVKTAEDVVPEGWMLVKGDVWAVSLDPEVLSELDESAKESFTESLRNFMDTVVGKNKDESRK